MYVRHLTLKDFRSYPSAELALTQGVTTLVGLNGQGKTNLVEAVGYLATLGSHRVATDQPLVRFGAAQAIVRGAVVRDHRETMVELEITPGRANRARLGRSPVARPRDVLGTLRTVLFAPEDLSLVKGDPSERRRFLDDLLVQRQPRWSGVRSDYDKIVKQRNALLKSAASVLRKGRGAPRRPRPGDEPVDEARAAALHTLDVWNDHLATVGSQLLYARLRLLRDLVPDLAECYDAVSAASSNARATYRSSLHESLAARIGAGEVPDVDALRQGVLDTLAEVRATEIERGVSLVGPHRDDVVLSLGDLPAKGYASHGESWSFALGLKLAAYRLLRRDLGDDPVLVLDDVFAELDSGRRDRLAGLIADCEQVLITAAVGADVPDVLREQGMTYAVELGEVHPLTPQPVPSPSQPVPSPSAPREPNAVFGSESGGIPVSSETNAAFTSQVGEQEGEQEGEQDEGSGR
ncbi:DNA recombination protein RecF [Intrasporangium oryzae NRRL B-24470]|uniref:DNA replication and repair protein RecF n=1 Tax=Intrasporangium oryzae NRRL B-24470 TaxID=1386089 RepID=W9GB16_9MICO|nr:DNA replication/repair protein RecF [Intrasporangium oryzae]EWT01039.1 DNA recombination protein RecF [Intrasporangium oryzae NRRL B-24470]